MKKVLVSFIFIFSLSQAQHVWAFSEEVLNASIEEYLQFFDEVTRPAQNEAQNEAKNEESAEPSAPEEEKEPTPEEIIQAKTEMLEKQLVLSRKAEALCHAVIDIGN